MTDLSDKLARLRTMRDQARAAEKCCMDAVDGARMSLNMASVRVLALDEALAIMEAAEAAVPAAAPPPAEPPPQPRRRGRPRKLKELTIADIPAPPTETLRIAEIDTTRPSPEIGGGTASGEAGAPPSDASNRHDAEDRSAPVAADPFHDFREAGREAARKGKPSHPDALWSQPKKDAYLQGYHEQLWLSERRSA